MQNLNVIIPAFNEAKRIQPTLLATNAWLKDNLPDSKILVINDGSTDDTTSVAKQNGARVKELASNQGKGAAVREGLLSATGDFTLIMDADNSTPITELPKMMEAADAGYDLIIGNRYLSNSQITTHQTILRRLISRLGNMVIRLLLVPKIRDTQCGFKLLSQRMTAIASQLLTHDKFSYDVELLTIARVNGLRIKEIPVKWDNDPDTRLKPFQDSWRFFLDILDIKKKALAGQYRDQSDQPSA